MTLDSFFVETVDQDLKERIKRLRSIMLINSCIYYEMNENVITDHAWQAFADELADIQNKHPDHVKINWFDQYFEGWDGTSGYNLPLRDPWVYGKAEQILRYHKKEMQNAV
ncbi:MAG: hypothetical protein EBR82_82575 [Caulobacteraceae bacterium]|nr:hypothetical protein [Caulobacteraceae bacterium]NDG30791.1 hypothetical protein [bacterium]